MGKKERKGKGRRTNIEKCKTGIAYQNKDIISKFFAESLKEKSLNVYGLNVPKVVGRNLRNGYDENDYFTTGISRKRKTKNCYK